MLRGLVAFSLQYRFLVLVTAVAVMALGLIRLRETPVDVLPEFSSPTIEIQTEALGLSAAEIEDLVTLNLEEILVSVPWLQTIRSKSITGLSSILLVFEPGTDLMQARQVVQERLNMAHALPNVSKPPHMLQPLSVASRAMIVGLSPKDISLIDASVLARWTITPKLLGVPGVANVAIWGLRSRQLQVQVDPSQLRDKDVTLNEIVKTAGDSMWVSPLTYLEASTPGAGGWIDTPNQRLGIQHVQPITTSSDLAKVAVAETSLRLGDVANVVEEHPPLIGDAITNGKPGLLLVIQKFPEANSRDVVGGVTLALNELKQGLPGIELDTSIYRASSFVDLAIDNLTTVLAAGVVLLAVAFGLCFLSWRAAFVGVFTVALAFLASWLVLYLRGAAMNIMVIAGFAGALAILIDDVVIGVDEVIRRLRRRRADSTEESAARAIFRASIDARRPMLYATLIILLGIVPLFLLTGPLGNFLGPLATSYVLALLVSFLMATTVVPALALVLFRSESAVGRDSPRQHWFERHFDAALSRLVQEPRPALLAGGLLLLAGLATLPFLTWSLVPAFKERDIRVTWQAPTGTSLPEMRRMATQAAQDLAAIPGVRNVAGHIGRAVTGDQIVGTESAQLWLSIDPAADYDKTLAAINEVTHEYPGLDGKVETYMTDRARTVRTEVSAPVTVRVQGPDRQELAHQAERVAKALSGIPGLVEPRAVSEVIAPQVEIKVDLPAAAQAGLKPGDIRRAAATIFAGLEVGHLFEQQKVFDVVVWGAPEVRTSVTNLRDLLIDTPNDSHVRLGDVAEVRIVPAPVVINRENVSRYRDITANVSGRDIGSVLADVRARLQSMQFPLEYHPVVLGDYEQRRAEMWQILLAVLVAAIGIYLVFQACFENWKLAAMVYAGVITAILGGGLAVLATGGTATLGSLIGALAVLGIATRLGILFVDDLQRRERESGRAPDSDLVLRGTRERLVPVLTTATATVLAFAPVLALGNVAGLEIVHPMAAVIVAGTVVAAIVTLFVLPPLYLRAATPASQRETQQALGSEQYV